MWTARGPAAGRPCSVVRGGVSERSPWGRASEESRSTRRENEKPLLCCSWALAGFVASLLGRGGAELPRTRRARKVRWYFCSCGKTEPPGCRGELAGLGKQGAGPTLTTQMVRHRRRGHWTRTRKATRSSPRQPAP